MAEEAEKVLSAARDGDIKALQSFRRSVPFATDSFGATALHHATRHGKLECVRWMVEKVGMKAKVKANNGATPLHDACTQGKLLCVKFFVQECQLNPDVCDNSGHTPLHLAARFGYVDIVKWMINKAKSNPRLKTMNRMNTVHFAAAGGHLSCLEFLISSGNTILLDERATDGTTPIFIASQNGHFPCLKYLHTVGAKCELRSRDGMHLIHAAAQNGHLDCIGYLVVNGRASETEGDSTGATPAHYASGEGHVNVLKWLSKRCDLNIKDQLGGTPLHDASEKGQLSAIQFLVENGNLNAKLKDNSGLTPIDLAEKYGHKRCLDYLREASLKANQVRAAKLMSYTHTFDKQSVEDKSGSSFLHVLKKKPRQMDRPSSPKSAKAPDVPPLDLSPEPSPRNTPIPCMIEFGKASEWQKMAVEDVAKEFPHTAEVNHSVEDQVIQREHILVSNGAKSLAPLNEEFWKNRNRNATPTRDVDAYTQNAEDARRFDHHPSEELTSELLEAAKLRTQIMNARMQNPTPSPLHMFDDRSEETEARMVEEFSSQIQAARAKRSPHSTLNKSDYEVIKTVEIENENMGENNENNEKPMELSDASKSTFEDQMLNRSVESPDQPVAMNSSPSAPKTLTDIFANSTRDPSPEPEKGPPENSQVSHDTSSPPKLDDTPVTRAAEPKESPKAPSPPPKVDEGFLPKSNQVKLPSPPPPHEVKDTSPSPAPPQKKGSPTPPQQADKQPSPQVEPPRGYPPQKNSNLYSATPLVQPSKGTSMADPPDMPGTSPTEEDEHKIDENEQHIDEENYMTTDEETEKTASLPRPEKSADDKVPLRQRQLQPLPHMTGMETTKKSHQEAIDQETWATLPEWKRQVLRNRIMKEQQTELHLRKQEEEERKKYAGIPAWKVPIMQREESDRKNREEKLAHLPDWKRQLILRKRAKIMN